MEQFDTEIDTESRVHHGPNISENGNEKYFRIVDEFPKIFCLADRPVPAKP
jgi:hypothetical protein